MRIIPVDTSRLKMVVVGEPAQQIKDGQAIMDRETGRPQWNIEITVIGEARAETVQLSLPEGGFPRELGVGAFIVAEGMTAFHWEKPPRWGVVLRAKSIKVVGGVAGVKGVAA